MQKVEKEKYNRAKIWKYGTVLLVVLCVGLYGIHINRSEEPTDEAILEVYEENGEFVQIVESQGYNDEELIELEVRINMDTHEVEQVNILEHSETEDYGGYITEEWFLEKFIGKTVLEDFKLVKIMPEYDNEIVAITGATKSSYGVVTGVNIAMENYRKEKELETND